MEKLNKPRNFKDLLELQQILDDEISSSRKNGFVPRDRNEMDIILSIDDEFQEWLKELPYDLNFKTWKQKEYNREKELEELTDVLFFFLQYVNYIWCEDDFEEKFNNFKDRTAISIIKVLKWINQFKMKLWNREIEEAFESWLYIVYIRGFNIDEILETYWKKWQINMERINKDWVIQERKREKERNT